jgi:hypothetical protein
MKIYHIEMSRFMDTYLVGVAYTSVTHIRIRTAFQANKDGCNYESTLTASYFAEDGSRW